MTQVSDLEKESDTKEDEKSQLVRSLLVLVTFFGKDNPVLNCKPDWTAVACSSCCHAAVVV